MVLVKCSREMLQDLHCLGQFRYCVGLLANFTHQCVEILLQDFNGSVQCLQSGAVKKMWSYQNKSTHKNHRMKCTHLFKKWNSDFFVHWTNFNMCNPTVLIDRGEITKTYLETCLNGPSVCWTSRSLGVFHLQEYL